MTSVYCSPVLVLAFVGFLALIVLFQILPTFILLFGMFKAAVFTKKCKV